MKIFTELFVGLCNFLMNGYNFLIIATILSVVAIIFAKAYNKYNKKILAVGIVLIFPSIALQLIALWTLSLAQTFYWFRQGGTNIAEYIARLSLLVISIYSAKLIEDINI